MQLAKGSPDRMLRLADTSVRLYRRRDGHVSLRLRSYLMIHCKDQGFRLSAYLNQLDCMLTLENGERVSLDDSGYSDSGLYKMEHMIHDLWASGISATENIQDSAALLRIDYRLLSFEGQGAPSVIETVVPVLARGIHAQRKG